MPSLATFNANNFFLRYRFADTFPGDVSRKSLVDAADVASVGFLPGIAPGGQLTNAYIIWDEERRLLARRALEAPDGRLPDILCMQEVENIHALRKLNETFLDDFYDHIALIDSRDPRNIDVGLMSRYRPVAIRTHVEDRNQHGARVFSRDCLEVELETPGPNLTVFINHLKSKFVRPNTDETRRRSHARRLAQARRVNDLVLERFKGQHDNALYAVIGDFNDTPESPWLAPLMNSHHLTDVVSQHLPREERWTYYWRGRNRVSQIDFVLASSALAARIAGRAQADANRRPHIERRGIGLREISASSHQILPKEVTFVHFEDDGSTPIPAHPTPDEKRPFRDLPRFEEIVANPRVNVSDHCPVKVFF